MSVRNKPLAPRPGGRAGQLAGDAGLSQRLTFLLNRVVLVLVDGTVSQFRALGLSIPAARALISLYECGRETTVGNLARMTSIEVSTMSHIVRRLEAQGLVSRERHEFDRRVVHAMLTEAGRMIGKQCREASLKHERVLLGGISAENHAKLNENVRAGFRKRKRRERSAPQSDGGDLDQRSDADRGARAGRRARSKYVR